MGNLSQHWRHIDWAMFALLGLLVAAIIIPAIVAGWHYLS
jgi:hypothetical protein